MKIMLKGRIHSIERDARDPACASDDVCVVLENLVGMVFDVQQTAKRVSSKMSFFVRPVVADSLRFGQNITVTIDVED